MRESKQFGGAAASRIYEDLGAGRITEDEAWRRMRALEEREDDAGFFPTVKKYLTKIKDAVWSRPAKKRSRSRGRGRGRR